MRRSSRWAFSTGPTTPFPHVYGGALPLAVVTTVVPVTVTDGILTGFTLPTDARA